MYANKHAGRTSAGRQSKDVLLRALAERDPGLGTHAETVALAAATAEALGLAADEVEHVRHASELHDVGKVAIPDAILGKPGPLTEEEWTFVRRHPIIGERIILAAPALARVAALVRSSHERWDGAGYPDGLAGDAIPLGARIVAVGRRFAAMTAGRPYRAARTPRRRSPSCAAGPAPSSTRPWSTPGARRTTRPRRGRRGIGHRRLTECQAPYRRAVEAALLDLDAQAARRCPRGEASSSPTASPSGGVSSRTAASLPPGREVGAGDGRALGVVDLRDVQLGDRCAGASRRWRRRSGRSIMPKMMLRDGEAVPALVEAR